MPDCDGRIFDFKFLEEVSASCKNAAKCLKGLKRIDIVEVDKPEEITSALSSVRECTNPFANALAVGCYWGRADENKIWIHLASVFRTEVGNFDKYDARRVSIYYAWYAALTAAAASSSYQCLSSFCSVTVEPLTDLMPSVICRRPKLLVDEFHKWIAEDFENAENIPPLNIECHGYARLCHILTLFESDGSYKKTVANLDPLDVQTILNESSLSSYGTPELLSKFLNNTLPKSHDVDLVSDGGQKIKRIISSFLKL